MGRWITWYACRTATAPCSPSSGFPAPARRRARPGPVSTAMRARPRLCSTAIAFAHAARVFGSLSTPAFDTYAAGLRTRAENAWDWATANPNVIFRNNDQATGTRGLGAGQQETDDAGRINLRMVAAIYLFALTGNTAIATSSTRTTRERRCSPRSGCRHSAPA